ncbi:MAG TPA: AAA family ATPase [Candidatus Binatia bacterium]|nr:AAA family ATPase [Candidatus Binatia bacterium]
MTELTTSNAPSRVFIAVRGPICAGKSSVIDELETYWPDTVSRVDIDVFKHQIDKTRSTEWRRDIALKSACFLVDELMDIDRTIISDIHSSRPEQYDAYAHLARANSYPFYSFLLYPPLQVCLARNKERIIPQVSYKISDLAIEQYWRDTYHIPGEEVFDTSVQEPSEIAATIFDKVTR